MNRFVGWFNRSLNRNESINVLESLDYRQESDRTPEFSVSDDIAIASYPEFASIGADIVTVFDGHIYWDESIALEHALEPTADGIYKAYTKFGDKFLKHMRGAYSLVIVDRSKKITLMALDRIGQKNLYYSMTRSGVVFGNKLSDVVKHPAVKNSISSQTIYNYIYFHHCPSPGTIYEGVHKVRGGEFIVCNTEGRLSSEFYSIPEFSENSNISEEKMADELREVLGSSVSRFALEPNNTGAFLSGGLDSSTITGFLAKTFPNECNSFTIGFPVDGYDETKFARIVSKHFSTLHHEYILTPEDTLNTIGKVASSYDEPFGNSSAIPVYYCAKLAKENGIQRLLAGDGGDELFSGNTRYLKQLVFERYQSVPSVLRPAIGSLVKNFPEEIFGNKLPHKIKRYIEQASTPLPDRLQDYNFLHRHSPYDIFSEGFLEDIDVSEPLELQRESYNRPNDSTVLNRLLYLDWKTTLQDCDLVKVNSMCELAGIEVVYPMLDDEVINLSTKIPSRIKIKDHQLRWFYKYAFSGFLPDEVINKSKHGFGLPFGIWTREVPELRDFAYDNISDLSKRPYFNKKFLDHSIKMHQSIHASYYGTLIWILMMLEQWFSTRE